MENTKEESLANVNEKGVFYKIRMFFKKLMGKNNKKEEIIDKKTNVKEESNSFKEYIKKTEDSQTELLKLQQRFRNGEIKDGELSQEQIDQLCNLYDSQIQSLRLSIEIRKKRIEEHRKKNKK